jgi:hypothetical protein
MVDDARHEAAAFAFDPALIFMSGSIGALFPVLVGESPFRVTDDGRTEQGNRALLPGSACAATGRRLLRVRRGRVDPVRDGCPDRVPHSGM